jgi:hypothetical protein
MFLFKPRYSWWDTVCLAMLTGLLCGGVAKLSDWWYWGLLVVLASVSAIMEQIIEKRRTK